MTFSELIPWWVGWLGPALFFALGLFWISLIPGLPVRGVRRRLAAATDWPERAAIGWEGRIMIGSSAIIWLPLAIALPAILIGPYAAVDSRVIVVALALIVLGRAVYLSWRFAKDDLGQPLPEFTAHVAGVARRWWPLCALFTIGAVAPSRLTSLWMIPWSALAMASLVGTRYLAEAWVWSKVASRADDRLERIVTAAATRAGEPTPRAFILDTHAANAAALPSRNVVIFTRRIAELLDDDELEAIALHEIAHLNERRSVTALRTLGLLAYFPILALKPLLGSGWVPLLLGLGLTVLILRIVKRMGATEEARADASAVESSHQSHVFGTGLLKVHREALIPSIVKGDPHGPLHERLERAGLEPDFEPVESSRQLKPLILPLAIFFVTLVVGLVAAIFTVDVWDGGTGSNVALALGWNEEEVLWYVGEVAGYDGEYDRAAAYLREAVAFEQYGALVSLSWVLGQSGRCDEVPAVFEELADTNPPPEDLESAQLWLDFCVASESSR